MFSKRRGRSAFNMVAIVRPSTWSFVGIPQSFVIRCISMVSSWGCLQCHSSTVWSGTSLKVPQSQPLISCTLFPNIFEIKSVKSRFEWNTELHRHVEEKVTSLTWNDTRLLMYPRKKWNGDCLGPTSFNKLDTLLFIWLFWDENPPSITVCNHSIEFSIISSSQTQISLG